MSHPAMIDRVEPAGRWEFDADVAACFDDMLRRSIPQHDLMRQLVFEVGSRYVQKATDVVDLGCSRGEAIDPFWRQFGAHNRWVLCDVSEPMLDAARSRYATAIDNRLVDVRKHDLRSSYPPFRASLTLCVLTLQFTPIEHRHRIVRDIFKATTPGGAVILVEKVLGATAETDALLVDLHHGVKAANGYDREAIARKRMSLEGVLVPVTARWNEELLGAAGFRHVECFWRCLNFAGWVGVRE
jgi:tRNA (cmo5U34)-methyltransferase